MEKKLRRMVMTGLFCAIVTVATMVVSIPIGVGGYVNLGDSMIFMASLLFGPMTGAIAGGIGASLADVLLGYSIWAPFTLVIKAIEGAVVGIIGYTAVKKAKRITLKSGLGIAVGGLLMVLGYFIAGWILFGFEASIPANLPNLLQAVINGVASILIYSLIARYVKDE